jgi:hypothetical protein
MSDRFELETDITNLHNIVADLELLAEAVLEERTDTDEVANALIGIAVCTKLRIDRLFETFKATFKLDEYRANAG